MELFYAYQMEDGQAWLDAEESAHCVRVLRHRSGDSISVIASPTATGKEAVCGPQGAASTEAEPSSAIYHCIISDDSPKGVVARVVSVQEGWGGHPYYLRMAVCPTKNIDRYEWFVEKAVELGVDEIVPVIGEHSERRVVRADRLQKIAVAAAKQSLKGSVPVIAEPISVRDFIAPLYSGLSSCHSERSEGIPDIRLIAYCADDVAPRGSIIDALTAAFPSAAGKGQVRAPEKGARNLHSPSAETPSHAAVSAPRITVLIGPEGDFSQKEVREALDAGFIPIHLGPSRLRTETAALTSVEAVYFTLGLESPAYDKTPPRPLEGNHL